MTGRAFRDASEPDEGSMTNPSEAMPDQSEAPIVQELEWLKRVTEDDVTNVYGRTIEIIRLCEEALEKVMLLALNAKLGNLAADEGFAMIARDAAAARDKIKGQNP